ncbi:MAG: alkaline phosphatase family protein [Bdellovibrionales bacterium]|nr:alkaline phosphatase family protein [Bdellovibrionales bacterium]
MEEIRLMARFRRPLRRGAFPQFWAAAAALGALLVQGCGTGSIFPDEHLPAGAFPIIQGATSSGVAQFGVLEPSNERFVYRAQDLTTGQVYEPQGVRPLEQKGSRFRAVTMRFVGLNFQTRYGLQVRRREKGGEPGEIVDYRRFKTLDIDREGARILVASCMDDTYKDEALRMWKQAAKDEAQVAFLIGDNAYADKDVGVYKGPADPATVWKRMVETRQLIPYFRNRDLTPVFATWDDHDYGVNDGDRTYAHRRESTEIFKAFFPMDGIAGTYEEGPGLARSLRYAGQRIVFLDGRSFRSPNGQGGADETHLGSPQERWLETLLSGEPVPTWLILGDQYFGAYHGFESYERNHPASFRRFLTSLKKSKSPLFFVSGDRHLVELMAIEPGVLGYPTFEFTTSAIHAKVFPSSWDKTPNPRQIEGAANALNYGLIETRIRTGGEDADGAARFRWDLNLRARGDGKDLFERDLEISR